MAEKLLGNLGWIDLETTGLDPLQGAILEVGLIITSPQLKVLKSRSWVVEIPATLDFDSIDPYVLNMHTQNGLFDACFAQGKPLPGIAKRVIALLRKYQCCDVASPDGQRYVSPLCGASVHFDRSWLAVHMPGVLQCLSHRHLDTSALLELGRRFQVPDPPKAERLPALEHRAIPDLLDCLAVAQEYAARLLVPF